MYRCEPVVPVLDLGVVGEVEGFSFPIFRPSARSFGSVTSAKDCVGGEQWDRVGACVAECIDSGSSCLWCLARSTQ